MLCDPVGEEEESGVAEEGVVEEEAEAEEEEEDEAEADEGTEEEEACIGEEDAMPPAPTVVGGRILGPELRIGEEMCGGVRMGEGDLVFESVFGAVLAKVVVFALVLGDVETGTPSTFAKSS